MNTTYRTVHRIHNPVLSSEYQPWRTKQSPGHYFRHPRFLLSPPPGSGFNSVSSALAIRKCTSLFLLHHEKGCDCAHVRRNRVKLQPPLRIAQGFPGSSIVCSPEEQQRQRQQQEQQGPPFSNMYDKAGSGSGSRSVSSIRDISNMPGTSHRSSSFNPSNQETPSRYDSPTSSWSSPAEWYWD